MSTDEMTYLIFFQTGFRLRNPSIMLASDHSNFAKRAWFQGPGSDGSYHEFEMHHFIGRYVRLETTSESPAILTLCEVEVFGDRYA